MRQSGIAAMLYKPLSPILLVAGLLLLAGCQRATTGLPVATADSTQTAPQRPMTFLYYPDQEVYFCEASQEWMWMEGGLWRLAGRLPARIQPGRSVEIELPSALPFAYHTETRRKYPPETTGMLP